MESLTEFDQFGYVRSSNISSVGTKDHYLVIEFNSGKVYRYPYCVEYYSELVSAPSVGKYFNEHLRTQTSEQVNGVWIDD